MMKKYAILFITVFSFYACNQERERPTEAFDTAREFIESSLKGDYDWARKLMLQDSVNLYELDIIEKKYKTEMSAKDKEGYKNATIRIVSVDNVSDSVVVVNFYNTYKKKPMPLKVIKRDGLWQVDFNYTFTGNL